MRKHIPRAWEFNRFWQKELGGGSRTRLVEDDLVFDDLPEELRMPQTRGEKNRFKLSLKKAIVEAHRGKTIPWRLVQARMRRKLNKIFGDMNADDNRQ